MWGYQNEGDKKIEKSPSPSPLFGIEIESSFASHDPCIGVNCYEGMKWKNKLQKIKNWTFQGRPLEF